MLKYFGWCPGLKSSSKFIPRDVLTKRPLMLDFGLISLSVLLMFIFFNSNPLDYEVEEVSKSVVYTITGTTPFAFRIENPEPQPGYSLECVGLNSQLSAGSLPRFWEIQISLNYGFFFDVPKISFVDKTTNQEVRPDSLRVVHKGTYGHLVSEHDYEVTITTEKDSQQISVTCISRWHEQNTANIRRNLYRSLVFFGSFFAFLTFAFRKLHL